MSNIPQDLAEELRKAYTGKTGKDAAIGELNKKLKKGLADYLDANEYAAKTGAHLIDALADKLSEELYAGGAPSLTEAEALLSPVFRRNFADVSGFAEGVQTLLNEKAGIGMKVVRLQYPSDKVLGLAKRISQAGSLADVSPLLLSSAEHFSRSLVDKSVRLNAKTQSRSGLRPRIIRKMHGSACEFCAERAGVHTYPGVSSEIFRRHRNCRCTIAYDPGDGSKRRQNSWTKKWYIEEEEEKTRSRRGLVERPRSIRVKDVPTKNFVRGSWKKYPVQIPQTGERVRFSADKIHDVHIIAGPEVKDDLRRSLEWEAATGIPRRQWRKYSGKSEVWYHGKKLRVEIHWDEGMGKREDVKVKNFLDKDEGEKDASR